MADVVEINDIDSLGSYHLAWDALHAETHDASFFNTLDWLKTYWSHFGHDQKLRVLIVRALGKPIGVVPLVVRREPSRLGMVRVLTYPLDYWGSSYSSLGACQTALLTMAMRHIAETPRDWGLFEPRWVAHDGSDRGRTARAMRHAGLPITFRQHAAYSLIDCDQCKTWDAYLMGMTAKARHELKRQRRQIENHHVVEHIRYRPEPHRAGGGAPAWELFEQCLEVSRSSWQADSTTGNTLCHTSVQPFLRDAHRQAARIGMLDLNLLMVDGRAAAYFYGYQTHGVVTGLRMGYDPNGPKGAGAVLLGRVIEDSFRRGDRAIDLGIGREAFKSRFRTSQEPIYRLTCRSPQALRVRAVEASRWVRSRVWPTESNSVVVRGRTIRVRDA